MSSFFKIPVDSTAFFIRCGEISHPQFNIIDSVTWSVVRKLLKHPICAVARCQRINNASGADNSIAEFLKLIAEEM